MAFAMSLCAPVRRSRRAAEQTGDDPCPPQPLESRVESLEKRVTQLEQLPARIDGLESQIQQLRTEMHDEFSAVRKELGAQISAQGTQMRVLHGEVISRIALLQEGLPTPRRKRSRGRL